MKPFCTAAARSSRAPGEWFMKTALVLLCAPISFIMSKYCVTIIKSSTFLASTPATSDLKALTESRRPVMMACRWRAMPWPCMYLASASALAWISVRAASASASLIARILTASPSSPAATRRRFILLISFIARFTCASGSMSVMGEARMEYPNLLIDEVSCVLMESEIWSLVSNTSSSSILGTEERTTSNTYDSIWSRALVRR
mmetsp:Transcript_27790/g.64861  ORF Transcript_27790/g.64861 Transcript_27790/m.64861 type:complete len:203 (-) Transcript_27790:346-954(-)